jgi:cellobiose phosphorylase
VCCWHDGGIPDEWSQFSLTVRLPNTTTRYDIVVRNPTGKAETVQAVTVDGTPGTVENGVARVALVKDGTTHQLCVTLGGYARAHTVS